MKITEPTEAARRQRPITIREWRPTSALFRSAVGAVTMVAVAVLWRRPDLLVLATPLAVVTVASLLAKPNQPPTLDEGLDNSVVREGDATTWHGSVGNIRGADLVGVAVQPQPWIELDPIFGALCTEVIDGRASASFAVRSTKWGRRILNPVHLVAMSRWAAFSCSMETSHSSLITLPLPSAFDAAAPMRPTEGLVGLYRSTRSGDGSEFSSVREFQPGDRIRRINWSRSLRSPTMHVNATWSDHDTHVALVVDATDEFGASDGVDGAASSLDTSVRAAGAISEHFARRGDRVSLRTFGSTREQLVAAGTGETHLRRVLDTLTQIRPAGPMRGTYRETAFQHWATGGAELTVVLSPLVAREALDRAVSLGRHGSPVVIVDTLPDDITVSDDPFTALAWRIRLLERRREARSVEAVGIPIVAWRGQGSLDQFLRDVARRSSAPRMTKGWTESA